MPIPLFDAHCDTIHACWTDGRKLEKNDLHVDLDRAAKYSPYAQFFAIWEDGKSSGRAGIYELFCKQYRFFEAELAQNSGRLTLCTTAAAAAAAAKGGKTAAFLSVEGAELLNCDEDLLEKAFGLGARAVNITWNYDNALSGSCAESNKKGLTRKGRDFVKKAQSLGMIVDLSHISERGFWDVLEIADKPVMASHSNSKTVCGHVRNLSDEQFKAIIAIGGVAGLNLYSRFLGERPGIDTAVSHIEHFLSLDGGKNVAIGADFDGCDELPEGIAGIEDMEKLYDALLRRNFSQTLVDDIFYNNLMRVVEEVCVI